MFKTIVRLSLLLPTLTFGATTTHQPTTHTYQLKNGLKVIVREDHRTPTVLSQIWYHVGSSAEQNGTTGIAHLLEHMMFRGSKRYPGQQLNQIIARNGGIQNAFTSYDQTVYFQMLPNDKLPLSFQLESDRMQNALLHDDDVKQEQQIVMEERRLRTDNQAKTAAWERFAAVAYVASPYHHDVIGWMHDLKHITAQDVRQFYHAWYAPNNATLIVIGDVDPEAVHSLAQRYFGPIPKRTLPIRKPFGMLPALGQRTVVVRKPVKLPWIMMGYQVPSFGLKKRPSTDIYALMLLSTLLGGYESALLPQHLVQERGLATAIQVFYDPYQRYHSLLTITATPRDAKHLRSLINAIKQHIKRLQTEKVRPSELNRAKRQWTADRIYRKDSMQRQAYEIGELESIGVPWQEAEKLTEAINAITAEQLQSVAKRYLNTRQLTLGMLKPEPQSHSESP